MFKLLSKSVERFEWKKIFEELYLAVFVIFLVSIYKCIIYIIMHTKISNIYLHNKQLVGNFYEKSVSYE